MHSNESGTALLHSGYAHSLSAMWLPSISRGIYHSSKRPFHTEVKAKILFATHFHEVTALEKSYTQLKNAHVRVEKFKNEIIFLHQLSPGVCHQSYGIEVAKLANLPTKVLTRAKEILAVLEKQSQQGNRDRSRASKDHRPQLPLFEDPTSPETLVSIDAREN